jgi:hypothetical protein
VPLLPPLVLQFGGTPRQTSLGGAGTAVSVIITVVVALARAFDVND